MTTAKLGGRYQIVIPKNVREVLNLKPGDRFDIKVENGKVLMIPQPSFSSRLFGKHKHIWQGEDAVAYIRSERESWRD
ncbi:AbrB/MazE/SpoVT family DNA-binding domain-containing protein [Oscillatoria salina]|uniref:AbrB/MazE/SpoVT family DNA-binding domain-containing protein n=1 Tax=Oscillatoria salina TaxID=331517 RepID=UPI0013B6D64D|nr:AbrB/MazE/SpoVT family DNA-binding domain-containing protein [Oscillatoria salina]MBZ8180926.1 AbrB/MazE/SpoVT family DNA-binding domain-containing protein [Oscillatoria salina IIICB1]NET89926.1 AbrB/MazE/SpoVT family DNA-binding domain-containing protein [Kamptonema sp. SIO1D9]